MPPLIALRWRRPLLVVIALGALLTLVIAGFVWHGNTTAVDSRIFRELVLYVHGHLEYNLSKTSEPLFTTSMAVVATAGALAARRWSLVALSVAGPPLSLFVTEIVLKPLVARSFGPIARGGEVVATNGSYPSGHETAVASVAVVLAVAVAAFRPPRPVWWLIALILAGWTVSAGVGLTRGPYHYATDIAGAVGVAAAVVLSTALALDAVGARMRQRRVSSPDARSLSSTSHAV